MYLPDLGVAQRVERHETWSDVVHAALQAELYPEMGAASLVVADGQAVTCGRRSPLNRASGLGMSGPVSASDLDVLEAFCQERGLAPRVRVCPQADASLLSALGTRGYAVGGFMNAYAQPVNGSRCADEPMPDVDIRIATEDGARRWFEHVGAGGDWAEPDGVTFVVIRSALKPGSQLYLAWRDGQAIAGAGLEIHEGVAGLMAAETLPAYRRQGVHAALIRARLDAASQAGCDPAVVHTVPGAPSQRNVLRAGFQLLYTTVVVTL